MPTPYIVCLHSVDGVSPAWVPMARKMLLKIEKEVIRMKFVMTNSS